MIGFQELTVKLEGEEAGGLRLGAGLLQHPVPHCTPGAPRVLGASAAPYSTCGVNSASSAPSRCHCVPLLPPPFPSPPTSREPKGRVFALTFPFSAVGGSLTNKVCGCYSPKLRTAEKTEKTSLDALLKQSLVQRLLGTEAYGDRQSSLKWVPLPW